MFYEYYIKRTRKRHIKKFNIANIKPLEYFLGNGNEKHLWASTVDNLISAMKEIYNKLEEKPEWLSLEQINNYEKEMQTKLNEKTLNITEKNHKKDFYER